VEADLVTGLLGEVGLPTHLADRVAVVGDERPFNTPFPVVDCAASVLASIGAAASLLWEDRTGEPQQVSVGRGHAGASLVGFAFQQLDPAAGATPVAPSSLDRPLVKLYPCKDGRWVHLQGQFPRLAARTCEVLGCDVDSPTDVVADRVARWDGLALEEALAEVGTCGAMARTKDEWSAHPQSVAIAPFGRVSIERIGDSPPEPLGRRPRPAAAGPAAAGPVAAGPVAAGPATRPLDGVRVLDLSRLLAGPTNGRTLAEHGADVLLVNSPRLDNIPAFVMDTSHGKRSCCVELDDPGGVATLRALAAQADVFTQGYRGGSLERRGFGPSELAELRPGIIVVTINCYGDAGPWRMRPGWEQMAQTVSGLAVGQGGPGHPVLVPAAACDYTTGYLAALGTIAALWRRSVEGGSYHVRASLCQTATWFASAPTVPGEPNGFGDVDSFLTSSDTPYGLLRHLAPVARLAATPARWEAPTSPIGTHRAAWLPADEVAVTI
jgi:crotonobetainyl-CoA:carnitine CoA-transferase CaiB-like acyl-CoA transferase